jgi:ribosome maturation factor RimP
MFPTATSGITLSLVPAMCIPSTAGDIQVVFAAISQDINHIAGIEVEDMRNASRKVEVAIGSEDNIRASYYAE